VLFLAGRKPLKINENRISEIEILLINSLHRSQNNACRSFGIVHCYILLYAEEEREKERGSEIKIDFNTINESYDQRVKTYKYY
jgi:hypothetical protein